MSNEGSIECTVCGGSMAIRPGFEKPCQCRIRIPNPDHSKHSTDLLLVSEGSVISYNNPKEELLSLIEDLSAELDPPEKDCSCHVSPPCGDCYTWGHQRDLKERAREIIAKYREAKL